MKNLYLYPNEIVQNAIISSIINSSQYWLDTLKQRLPNGAGSEIIHL